MGVLLRQFKLLRLDFCVTRFVKSVKRGMQTLGRKGLCFWIFFLRGTVSRVNFNIARENFCIANLALLFPENRLIVAAVHDLFK